MTSRDLKENPSPNEARLTKNRSCCFGTSHFHYSHWFWLLPALRHPSVIIPTAYMTGCIYSKNIIEDSYCSPKSTISFCVQTLKRNFCLFLVSETIGLILRNWFVFYLTYTMMQVSDCVLLAACILYNNLTLGFILFSNCNYSFVPI